MEIITEIDMLRKRLNEIRKEHNKPDVQVGLVPTMGALHAGHMSLIQKAKQMTDIVVLTIFVNPIQFGPTQDFENYPRDEQKDIRMAKDDGVHLLFMPTVKQMYPTSTCTHVHVSQQLTSFMCGISRPGHFDGVATVVSKLFHIIQPDAAFFGMKDAQQVAVIKQMVYDLNFPIQIVVCPTVREADGLALSSRNVHLNREERQQATLLAQALFHAKSRTKLDEDVSAGELLQDVQAMVCKSPLAKVDYVEIVTFPTFIRLKPEAKVNEYHEVLLALAVTFGTTRLIDNMFIKKKHVIL